MFRMAVLIVLTLVFAPRAWPEQAGARVALVVGVGAYKHVPALTNTLNDARVLSAALTRLGFEVDTVTDPDRAGLEASVRRFGKRAAGAEAAVFFYAGHALEFGGHNWLAPVEADLRNERDLRFKTVQVDVILEQTEGQARVSVLMLDSCRDNPFRKLLGAGGRGLASDRGLAPQRAAVGSLVVYATAPGAVAADGAGPNSPFTTALLRHIETPGLEVRRMLAEVRKDVRQATGGRQIPWDSSALEGEFFFKPAALVPPPPSADTEVAFWNSVRDSNDATELRAYLTRFPNGAFTELARNRLMRLTPKPASPTPPPPASAPAAPDFQTRLRAALTMVREENKLSETRDYARESGGRALAVAPGQKGTWRITGQVDDATAEVRTLEACQIYYDEPCMLVARGDQILPKSADGAWPRRPQPRVVWRGDYDPAQVPALNPKDRLSPPVVSYQGLPEPKAMAFHPWGRIFLGKGADQTSAEEEALKACTDDPVRKGRVGPCFLYASGNRVILPDRRITPLGSDPPGGIQRIAAAARTISAAAANAVKKEYTSARGHKAIAVNARTGHTFYWRGMNRSAQAEQWALEGCQIYYGSPCYVLAVNNGLRATLPSAAVRRSMERVTYAGAFQASMSPMYLETAPDVLAYPGLPGTKAIAIRMHGARLSVISGRATIAEAERDALASCNADKVGPCFLYASDMKVVLPERRTKASR